MKTLLQIYSQINEDNRRELITLQKEVNPRVTISVTIEDGMIKKIKNDFHAPFPFRVGERAVYYQIQNFGDVNGYKIIGEAKNNMLRIVRPKGMSLTEAVELVKNGHGIYYGKCGHLDHQCRCMHSNQVRVFMKEDCSQCQNKDKQENINEQTVPNSEGDGFVPKSKNKKFNIILKYKKYPKERFDVVLDPREYRTEQAFITAVLDDIAIYKLPYLFEMSVLQYFTSNPNQLPPYLRANKGIFKFK